jgi:hypothetical protein
MKKVLALVLITVFQSCGKTNSKSDNTHIQKIVTITNNDGSEYNEFVSNDQQRDDTNDQGSIDDVLTNNLLKINATLINFDSDEKLKMENALKLLTQIINGEEFKQKVLNHTYNGQKTFVKNKDFSNQKILESIMDGSEEQFIGKNNTLDLRINLYYSIRNTVGYTYTDKLDIFVNEKFFDIYKLSSVAANIMHEWLHKLGYDHSRNYTQTRNYSVPYAIGNIVKEIGEEMESL